MPDTCRAAQAVDDEGLLAHWSEMLLFVTLVGMHRGWWSSVTSMSRAGLVSGASSRPDEMPAAAASHASTSMQASKEEANAKRGGCVNQMHYAGTVLASTRSKKLCAVIVELTRGFRERQGTDEQRTSTRKGSFYYNYDMSDGAWVESLVELVSRTTSRESMRRVGLSDEHGSTYSISDEVDQDVDACVAAHMFSLTVHLLHRYVPYFLCHTKAPPRALCRLLGTDDERAACLSELRAVWEHSTVLEEAMAAGSTTAKEFHAVLLWPLAQWPRELLLGLLEANWAFVPRHVYEALLRFNESFASTWVVELAVNRERNNERASTAKIVGRNNMWHTLTSGSLLAEHDHEQPHTTDKSKSVVARSPTKSVKNCFLPHVSISGLDESMLQSLHGEAWSCPSPELFRLQGAMTMVLQSSGGNTDVLEKAYYALLFQPLTLMQRMGAGFAKVVVGTFPFGVLTWLLKPRRVRRHDGTCFHWLEFADNAETRPYDVELITSFDGWRCSDLTAVSPSAVAEQTGDTVGELPRGIALVPGVFMSALEMAARSAFAGMTVRYLTKLFHDFGLGRPPKTEKALLEGLVRHSLPAATEDEIKQILLLRAQKHHAAALAQGELSVFAGQASLGILEEALDQDELEALQQAKQNYAAAKAHFKGKGSYAEKSHGEDGIASGGVAGGAASSSGGGKKPAGPVPEGLAADPEEYRRYMPPLSKLYIETHWHYRWVAHYPADEGPLSHSATFGGRSGRTVRDAFLQVARWAWLRHAERTGGEIPDLVGVGM